MSAQAKAAFGSEAQARRELVEAAGLGQVSPNNSSKAPTGRNILSELDQGILVGIDIDHASAKLDLRELVTSHVPLGIG